MPAIHWLIGRETTARLALALLTATLLVGCEEALEGIDDLDLGGPDLPPVTGTIQPRFETDGVDFLRMPWPSDYRLDDDGRFILDDFPNATSGILGKYVDVVTEEVRGFAYNVEGAEGDLTMVTSSELAAGLDGVDYRYDRAATFGDAAVDRAGYQGGEVVFYVLLCAIVLLLIGEQLFAYSTGYHPPSSFQRVGAEGAG